MVEAAFSVVRQPGPLHAFYERLRSRRGHQIAVVASARKLACLFWCLLTREEQYAHRQPSLTAKKEGVSSSVYADCLSVTVTPGLSTVTVNFQMSDVSVGDAVGEVDFERGER